MRHLHAIARLLHAVGLALQGWWIIRRRFELMDDARRATEVERWARRMLRVLGIQLLVQGEPPPARTPLLLISNHISWLDILVLHAARHVRFVSKSAVKGWPFIGLMATAAGTLYIERERRRDAMRVVHHMTEALRNGDRLAVFPEGTTSDGRVLLPFHANLLQAAISAGVPVLPAALRFVDAATGQTSFAPRYVDEDTLLSSLWRTLCAPPLLAIVRYGQLQDSHGRDRREWAQSLYADVTALREQAVP
ncbi:lysophospholipid acyltransferase family protein [Xenophilus arseniciresistens]|uniref:Lysophospholipid acyltransferase family protein n=1 Tax=Xenophilus arseniciresistens TaxID=1283306 RepID=A0AAE3N8S6_9BURK|nr:lysophospholipid acyltransferase family protein [Xenophilus arseniciresistens]MDA7415379.1 lysophospholipid acyltransferase family protein [Xenophilus arseniciresistens]